MNSPTPLPSSQAAWFHKVGCRSCHLWLCTWMESGQETLAYVSFFCLRCWLNSCDKLEQYNIWCICLTRLIWWGHLEDICVAVKCLPHQRKLWVRFVSRFHNRGHIQSFSVDVVEGLDMETRSLHQKEMVLVLEARKTDKGSSYYRHLNIKPEAKSNLQELHKTQL
jgi:hypothetical protein